MILISPVEINSGLNFFDLTLCGRMENEEMQPAWKVYFQILFLPHAAISEVRCEKWESNKQLIQAVNENVMKSTGEVRSGNPRYCM